MADNSQVEGPVGTPSTELTQGELVQGWDGSISEGLKLDIVLKVGVNKFDAEVIFVEFDQDGDAVFMNTKTQATYHYSKPELYAVLKDPNKCRKLMPGEVVTNW